MKNFTYRNISCRGGFYSPSVTLQLKRLFRVTVKLLCLLSGTFDHCATDKDFKQLNDCVSGLRNCFRDFLVVIVGTSDSKSIAQEKSQ